MDKSPEAFRTISEVAEDLDLPQHVLRFWETRFTQIKPLKRGGGRRYYRPDDVDLLKGIRYYLYGEGYTIQGAQRILKERGVKHVIELGRAQTENYAPPVAVIPRAEDEATRRERRDWPEAVLLDSGLAEAMPSAPARQAAPAAASRQRAQAAATAGAARSAPAAGRAQDTLAVLRSVLLDLADCRHILDSAR